MSKISANRMMEVIVEAHKKGCSYNYLSPSTKGKTASRMLDKYYKSSEITSLYNTVEQVYENALSYLGGSVNLPKGNNNMSDDSNGDFVSEERFYNCNKILDDRVESLEKEVSELKKEILELKKQIDNINNQLLTNINQPTNENNQLMTNDNQVITNDNQLMTDNNQPVTNPPLPHNIGEWKFSTRVNYSGNLEYHSVYARTKCDGKYHKVYICKDRGSFCESTAKEKINAYIEKHSLNISKV